MLPISLLKSSVRDEIVNQVNCILALRKKQLRVSQIHSNQLQMEIDIIDHKIDRLVYKIYNLTPEEISIVEGKKDPETAFLELKAIMQQLSSTKERQRYINKLSDEELDAIQDGMDLYRQGKKLSATELNELSSWRTRISERPPRSHTRHSA